MSRSAPWAHQVRTIEYALENPYSILALDPRLGKTRCAIEVREKTNLPCLVICPSYLVDNWKKDIHKWVDDPKIVTIHKGKDIGRIEKSVQYVIASYSLVQKAPHFFEWAKMVVLDEAPAIKSMKAQRTQFIHKEIFENSLERVLELTGTPIKNRVQEFYSLLALTYYNPNAPQSEFLNRFPDELTFAEHFSYSESYEVEYAPGRYHNVVKFYGIRNTKELKQWLDGRYIRIRDTDVLDMPEVTTNPILISDIADRALLNAFNSFFSDDREDERKNRTGSVLPEHKAKAALKKVPFTINYVKDLLEQVECVLVYTDHIEAAEALAKEFKVKALTGHVPSKKRAEAADRFQAGDGRVLVATIGSLKEGKDLYRANHIVFNDLSWIPGDMKQVVNRIRVVGKQAKCTAHRIFGSPQDEYIANVLDEKIATIEAAT